VLDGLVFPEGPRWHDDRLWFSDMHDHRVVRFDPATGSAETVVEVEQQPSGLGWLPDGRLLVVAMRDRRLLRLDADGLHEHADLSGIATFHCNDMVVDGQGRAYVGNFGFNFEEGEAPTTAAMALVRPDGTVELAADELAFPNGTVITPDGVTLIVAESTAARLTAFTIATDGSLYDRRVFAQLDGVFPDGICLDAEGAVWVASPFGHVVVRVREGGEVTDRIDVGELNAYACMLGGPSRTTLFICIGPTHDSEEGRKLRGARIDAVDVNVPGAGWP
jgi:sugar lactone lactonase YvrE